LDFGEKMLDSALGEADEALKALKNGDITAIFTVKRARLRLLSEIKATKLITNRNVLIGKHTECCVIGAKYCIMEARKQTNKDAKLKKLAMTKDTWISSGLEVNPDSTQLHYVNAVMRVDLANCCDNPDKRESNLKIAMRYLTLHDHSTERDSMIWSRSRAIVESLLSSSTNDIWLEWLGEEHTISTPAKSETIIHQSPREMERWRRRNGNDGGVLPMSPQDIVALQERMNRVKELANSCSKTTPSPSPNPGKLISMKESSLESTPQKEETNKENKVQNENSSSSKPIKTKKPRKTRSFRAKISALLPRTNSKSKNV